MRIPESLEALIDHGVVEDVIRPLMSGKEAQVYLVVSGGEPRVAKIYKEAQNRTFKNRAEYTEGRKTRNSRDQRAMAKRSRHGRAQDEAAWRSTEVDMIYRLREAGVRVPEPHHFIDGVLIMEMVQTAEGHPAPRLGELTLPAAEAKTVFEHLLREVVRMLCAGVVHGDLSEFNVLMAADGPVIIDFPQAVDASSNRNARKLLLRDVDNLYRFAERFGPWRGPRQHAQEMWALYEGGELTPNSELTGKFAAAANQVDTGAVVSLIADANLDERRRREAAARSTLAPSGGRRRRGGPTVETVSLPPRNGMGPQSPHEGPREPRNDTPTSRPPRDAQRPRGAHAAPRGERPNRDTQRPRGGNAAPRGERPNRDAERGNAAPRGERPNRDAERGNAAPRGERPNRDGGPRSDGARTRHRAPRDSGRLGNHGQRPDEAAGRRDGTSAPRGPRDGNEAPRGDWRRPSAAPREPRSTNWAPRESDRGPRPQGDRGPRPQGGRPNPPGGDGRRPPRRR